MSTNRTDFIIYGWKLPYVMKDIHGEINFWDDMFQPYLEWVKVGDIALIQDVHGKYNVFGIVLNSSSGGFYAGWNFDGIDINGLDKEKVTSGYKHAFGIPENEPVADPYLFIFSHYT